MADRNAAPLSGSPVHESARAKINLFLHVTGQRADGYHEIDSLTVFATLADSVHVNADRIFKANGTTAPLGLDIVGPFASQIPAGDDNLVLRASRHLFQGDGAAPGAAAMPARMTLTKRIPAASGIGGGSADAAAAIRALNRFWHLQLDLEDTAHRTASLGADIPMCLWSEPLRARGIGDKLAPVSGLPELPAVLVNPGIGLETPHVFKALKRKRNPGAPRMPKRFASIKALAGYLRKCRNDLEPPAIGLEPEIAECINALEAHKSCLLARMSGSGATCFGLFDNDRDADAAARTIASARPGWWVRPTKLNQG